MIKIAEPMDGLLLCAPTVFEDQRGWFFECYSKKTFQFLGIESEFVQDNRSFSVYGTLRGLHFQRGAAAQAKLVNCTVGEVLDVVVDLRADSKTFGQHYSIKLSAENKQVLFIPKGFAHGFVVLSPQAEFNYKCDQYYTPEAESGIRFDDPQLKINWGITHDAMLVSKKDLALPFFSQIKMPVI